jgi:replicative DNA helicase
MHATRPKLLVMGPIYNLAAEDVSSHSVVGKLKQVINKARALYGTAVVMEHHAPHKGPMDTVRSVRPYGSSTFLKWPDYGYGFRPMEGEREDYDELFQFEKIRHNRVRGRVFPEFMRNGKPLTDEFPWMSCNLDNEGNIY